MILNHKYLLRLALTALSVCLVTMTAEGAIIPRLQRGEHLTIAAIGTSLTASTAWFDQVGAWLQTTYPGQVAVQNKAVGGSASKYTDTYTWPASGLDVQLGNVLGVNPDAIFIEFSINDAFDGYGITPQMSRDNLQTMINNINLWSASHKPVDIVVQTMNNVVDTPVHKNATYRPDLETYYEGYREVAATNHVLLIDHYPNWVNLFNSDRATWDRCVPDGLHPSELGSRTVIVPEIQRVLNSQAPEPSALVLSAMAILGLTCYASLRR